MNSYIIYTDSATDMPHAYFEKYDIRVVTMDYLVNGESIEFHTESADHDKFCDELYAKMKEGADVHTSQITPFRYIDTWEKELKEGNDILYIGFSSGMSATYENAINAVAMLKEDYPDRTIEVVDSLSATAGQGVLTYTAALNREQGMNLEENAAWINDHKKYICHRFTVGDLDYLHKGGRVSKSVAVIGGMLNIKPLLIIDDEGKLQMTSTARGRKSALRSLVKGYQKEMGVEGVPKVVFIIHTSLYDEANKLKDMLQEVVEEGTQIEVMCETPIIGAHTGPDFFAICGYGQHRKEQK